MTARRDSLRLPFFPSFRPSVLPSFSRFRLQRDRRVHPRRPSGRHPAGQRRHRREQRRHRDECDRIGRRDVEELAARSAAPRRTPRRARAPSPDRRFEAPARAPSAPPRREPRPAPCGCRSPASAEPPRTPSRRRRRSAPATAPRSANALASSTVNRCGASVALEQRRIERIFHTGWSRSTDQIASRTAFAHRVGIARRAHRDAGEDRQGSAPWPGRAAASSGSVSVNCFTLPATPTTVATTFGRPDHPDPLPQRRLARPRAAAPAPDSRSPPAASPAGRPG